MALKHLTGLGGGVQTNDSPRQLIPSSALVWLSLQKQVYEPTVFIQSCSHRWLPSSHSLKSAQIGGNKFTQMNERKNSRFWIYLKQQIHKKGLWVHVVQNFLTLFVLLLRLQYIPLHLVPSTFCIVPLGQVQVNDPGVLVHSAPCPHGIPSRHSSTSAPGKGGHVTMLSNAITDSRVFIQKSSWNATT